MRARGLRAFLLAGGLVLSACTSLPEAVHELDALQEEPSAPELMKELDPAHGGRLVFAARMDGEEVKKPEEEALDALEVIREHDFRGEPAARARAVRLLCRTALRGPAALVRASAFRSLARVLGAEPSGYAPALLNAEEGDYRKRVERLSELAEGEVRAEDRPYVEPLLTYFLRVRPPAAADAVSALEALCRFAPEAGPAEGGGPSLVERTRTALCLQASFLSAVEGLRDRDLTARLEAVDLLFRFPWSAVRRPLAENLEWNPYLMEPALRNRVLLRLKEAADRPETIGLNVLKQVARGLDFADGAVVWRTVDLFRSLTGLGESDPDFWRDWWKEYLLKHAADGN